MPPKFLRVLFRRRIIVTFMLLAQIALIIYFLTNTSRNFAWINKALYFISFFVVLYIVNKQEKGAYRFMWALMILIFPLFGASFYLLFRYQSSTKRFREQLMLLDEYSRPIFFLPGDCYNRACAEAPEYAPQMHYLQKFAGFPIYGHTKTKYLSPGEAMFKCLLEALSKAEKYIFLEYFIVQEGLMWNSVLDILREKAKHGVDVRIMYDDMGCFLLLPKDYTQTLEKMGIQCAVFNPFRPILTATQNNRDHRKITVIDGKIAFTGGVNLADEYINAKQKYGHWKDASIMLEGDAAWSFTLMFLQMWGTCKKIYEDYASFYPGRPQIAAYGDGFVQPYADSPMDMERIGEHVYMQLITNAKKYIYINTPYLIIDDHMMLALTLAAKGGIDVRIVTPHQWDKWYVHMTTRSYYRELIRAGVKIYEYSKGFNHSKTFVSDDKVATVGTPNLDFRSLYLHFECGVWMYKSKAVMEVYDDFMQTLEHCHQITEQDCKGNRLEIFVQDTLRILAPLM